MASVKIRKVFENNLEEEFKLIEYNVRRYPYLSIDTEFPGTVFQPNKPYYELSPAENYAMMKQNVDRLKLIQLGLTLSDSEGNLPNFGSSCSYIWEFNFQEFDEDEDLYNPDSIKLLKGQGIDFLKNKAEGIHAKHFAQLFMASGLGFSFRSFVGIRKPSDPKNVTWVFFHSTYDVGYLMKLLTQKELPPTNVMFMALVRIYLGPSVFDLKEMIKPLGWKFGLEKVANNLQVDRVSGESHQAGSDSLLTMQCFLAFLINRFEGEQRPCLYQKFNHKLYGLDVENSLVQQELMRLMKDLQSRRESRFMYCQNRAPFVYYSPCVGGGNRAILFPPNTLYQNVAAVPPICLGY